MKSTRDSQSSDVSNESTSSNNCSSSSALKASSSSSIQINSLNRVNGRSAFSPYSNRVENRQSKSTVLTNLQRGNVQTQASSSGSERNIHQLAAQGELFEHDLNKESNVDSLDSNGLSPLHWACWYGQLATFKLLISRGADPTLTGREGQNALHFACSNGHVHVVKELIASGIDVNHVDEDANSALMFAAYGNHALCANELLKCGADITLQNSNLDTVFSIAVKQNSKQVQSLLEKHMIMLMSL